MHHKESQNTLIYSECSSVALLISFRKESAQFTIFPLAISSTFFQLNPVAGEPDGIYSCISHAFLGAMIKKIFHINS